jgi:hypothetical protein
MSMHKDQVVNASIDGKGVKRALIPFHVLNAGVWHDQLMKEEKRDRCKARVIELRAELDDLEASVASGFA